MKLLELGCGELPAIERGGTIFENDDIQYTGVDLVLPTWLKRDQAGRFIEADITSMPFFDDSSFDLLLIRNFFGQFGDGGITPGVAERVIVQGIREAHRVLKPLGQLAVVEENTPMDSEDVVHELELAGFHKLELEEMTYGRDNFGTDNPWRRLRSRYYNDRPIQAYPDEWLGDPYVLLVAK
jgi:ubiquinone/menaquinone biosynthesis C-methylase UbiE